MSRSLGEVGYPYRCHYCGKNSPPAFTGLPEGWIFYPTGEVSMQPMCPSCQRTFGYAKRSIELLRKQRKP